MRTSLGERLTEWLVAGVLWGIRIFIVAILVIGTFLTLTHNTYTKDQWIAFFIFGLSQGSIYAMIALGYTMVYGILRMINFAHGDIFMAGSFSAYFVADALSRSGFLDAYPLVGLPIIVLFAMAISTLLAVIIERIAYRPLRNAPRLVPLISAIGASFVLEYSFKGFFGAGVDAYPEVKVLSGEWQIFGIGILKIQVVIAVVAILMMVLLYYIVMRTKIGKAMRAVSENKDVAALMGIDVNQIIVATFAIGAAMAGAAGVLYGLMFRQVNFFMGFFPGVKAFTAAVLGGIGNIPGAMLGGLVLGILESVGPILFLNGLGIPRPYQLHDVLAFTVLVLILLFRPSGILGEAITRKKA
ncbi:MAG TPA: branched-chain amino acid ABC transporter permease [Anaerolineales bacterium]|jgi:branched-chain amino acid transport system permease protein|nr:branched-chain amino acid ABC transporter permease [Anaerolineales bacterium]